MPPALNRARPAEQIVENLRDQIARGQLARGSRLPSEREIAEHFEVSPPTAREALRALASMGLVESRHGSGTYVTARPADVVTPSLATAAQLQDTTVGEIIELLAVLNLRAAELAVVNATDSDIERLATGRDSILDGESREEILTGVEAFLRALADAAHQPLLSVISDFLIRVLVAVELEVFPESVRLWREWTGSLADVRAEIVDALHARDGARLQSAVRAYHASAADRLDHAPEHGMKLSDQRLARVMARLTARP
ncbi:GntR family transcriptional regulator [Streptomyces sp. NPDC001642]|uniref:FadR/GntR family transcriptional regulator n=1 Tax=Streptomyces sp. NPDC001642 TaxID=3154392 RepID=UPI00331AF7A6